MTPEYRILLDHLHTDVTGWVIAEVIPGMKFDSHEEAKKALARIVGEVPPELRG